MAMKFELTPLTKSVSQSLCLSPPQLLNLEQWFTLLCQYEGLNLIQFLKSVLIHRKL